MASAVSRRRFLRGDFSGGGAPLRPPWAIGETSFPELCSRCGECLDRCPTGIIVPGSGGFPVVDFSRGECRFCDTCTAHCEPGALSGVARARGEPAWERQTYFTEACLSRSGVVCRSCADQCVTRAIRFRPQAGGAFLPRLEPALCNGCGACVAPCPVGAVEIRMPH